MMDEHPSDHYLTLASNGEAKTKVKGSVFLAFASPVKSEQQAILALENWRKQFYDATHVGSAWRLSPPPNAPVRYDDDGEPHGTTGPPILHAIEGENLWGVIVAVVRYYGGTKLGTGGLIRAYGGAAAEALANAPRKRILLTKGLRVEVTHERSGPVFTVAEKHGANLEAPQYTVEGAVLEMRIAASRVEALAADIVEATAGRANVEIIP